MRRKRSGGGGGGGGSDPNAWMATFSDLNFLMITFFVLLLSMSSMDDRRFSDVFGDVMSEEDDLIVPEPPLGDAPMPPIIPPRASLLGSRSAVRRREARMPEVEDAVDGNAAMARVRESILASRAARERDQELARTVEDNQQLLHLEDVGPDRMRLSIDSSVIFEGEGVDPSAAAVEVLRTVASIAVELEGDLLIEAGGSWELASRRSAAVARVLHQLGVPGARLTADAVPSHPGRVEFEINRAARAAAEGEPGHGA